MSIVKNVTLLGHAGSGKTTLSEAMLYAAGITERIGNVANGNTISDFDAEEKKRGVSISTAVLQFNYGGAKLNVIDTPGLFDFALGPNEGLRAADCALIVLSARSGLSVGAEKAYKNAAKKGIARAFVATKMDDERADFFKVFHELQDKFGSSVCPVVVPMPNGGFYNLLEDKAYTYNGIKRSDAALDDDGTIEELIEAFNEAVAGADDELMEKYFEGEELTHEDKLRV